MDGIENIIARISADAEQEARQLLTQAQEQAAVTGETYRAQAERETAAALEAGKRKAAVLEEQLVNAARLEGRKALLAEKQNLVEEAFQRALKQLQQLPEETRVQVLADLAVQAAVTGEEEVILSPADRERLGHRVVALANETLEQGGMLPGHLTLSGESREMAGGVILKDGKVEANGSFETLLHLRREELSAHVAAVLFP